MTLPVRPAPQRSLLACTCFLALAALGCDQGEKRGHSGTSTITILGGRLAGAGSMEWPLSPGSTHGDQHAVFLSLVRWDEGGRVEGRLAERWEHSPDYRTWTFHLRRDVRWHDGVPTTTHDVKFTLELFAHPDVLSPTNDFWRDMESFTVLDDYTFTITYTKPTDALNLSRELPVFYPKHLLEDLDPKEFYQWEFWMHPVGNGPYRYVHHVPHTMIEYEANPDYYRGKPKIERVVNKYGGGAPLIELLSGNVDVAAVNQADIPKLAGDPRFRLYYGVHWHRLFAIHWNQRHPLFRDPRVRRALTLAINRRELLQVLNLPEDLPIVDGMYTARQFRRGDLPEPLPYDPERAAELLDAVGWRDQDGDGVRERAGVEARFTAFTRGGHSAAPEEAAIYVQDQLRRVGIRMEVQTLEWFLLTPRIRAGEFDAAFDFFPNNAATWIPSRLRGEWFGEGSPIGYTNPELVRLLETALITIDPEAKDQIYREVMEIFRAEVPVTILFPPTAMHVAHRRFRGFSSPRRGPGTASVEYAWIEEQP